MSEFEKELSETVSSDNNEKDSEPAAAKDDFESQNDNYLSSVILPVSRKTSQGSSSSSSSSSGVGTPKEKTKKTKKTKKPNKKRKKRGSEYVDDEASSEYDEAEEVSDSAIADDGDGLRPRQKREAEEYAAELEAKRLQTQKTDASSSEKRDVEYEAKRARKRLKSWTDKAADGKQRVHALEVVKSEIEAEIDRIRSESKYAEGVLDESKDDLKKSFVSDDVVFVKSKKYDPEVLFGYLERIESRPDAAVSKTKWTQELQDRETVKEAVTATVANAIYRDDLRDGLQYSVQASDGADGFRIYTVVVSMEKDNKRACVSVQRAGSSQKSVEWQGCVNYEKELEKLSRKSLFTRWQNCIEGLCRGMPKELKSGVMDLACLYLMSKREYAFSVIP